MHPNLLVVRRKAAGRPGTTYWLGFALLLYRHLSGDHPQFGVKSNPGATDCDAMRKSSSCYTGWDSPFFFIDTSQGIIPNSVSKKYPGATEPIHEPGSKQCKFQFELIIYNQGERVSASEMALSVV